jgi:hypothetical protein
LSGIRFDQARRIAPASNAPGLTVDRELRAASGGDCGRIAAPAARTPVGVCPEELSGED